MAGLLKRSPNERTRYSLEYPCHSWQCERCGWNPEEYKRRINNGLTRGGDGLKHFAKTKVGETCDSTDFT